MSDTFSFVLSRWSGWLPGVRTHAEWRAWHEQGALPEQGGPAPDISFVPALLRRRCSAATRAALAAARAAAGEGYAHLPSLFASRHGEAETTLEILKTLARQELVSPTDFSLSVHNAASGLYSISSSNRSRSTAIAARERTFTAALLEIGCQLDDETPALLAVISDEALPELYRPACTEDSPFFALALLACRPGTTAGPVLTVATNPGAAEAPSGREPRAISFMRWLWGASDEPLSWSERGVRWTLTRSGEVAECFEPVGAPPIRPGTS